MSLTHLQNCDRLDGVTLMNVLPLEILSWAGRPQDG